MSTAEDKVQARETGGLAQRTYKSLAEAHRGIVAQVERSGEVLLAIAPMDETTWWRKVGGGKWDAAVTMYEQTEGP